MEQATGVGFDISGLEKALQNADKGLKDLQKTSDEVTKSMNKAFESVAQGGIKQLSQSVEALNRGLKNLGKSSGGKDVAKSMENISKSTDNVVDKVNRMTTLMQTITDGGRSRQKNGKIESLNQEIGASMAKLDQLRQKMNFYTKGEGRKALDANVAPDMSKTMQEANALRVRIELLQREREHLQANAALKERAGVIARQQGRDTEWSRMEQEKRETQRRNEEEKRETQRRNEEERKRQELEANRAISKERIEQLGREREQRERIEKMMANTQRQAYAQREKELNDLFRNSTKGAIGYGQDSRTALRSVDTIRDAISKMEEAQRKVNTSTKSGQKEYNLLTREIMKSKAELAKLTGEGRNLQNSLGPLGRMMTTLFSVQAIRGFVNKMVQVRGEFEQINKAMQVIIGNKEQANRIWDQTVELAVKSPFSVQDLVKSTRQLAAYRIETEKLYETNKMLADISAGLGVDMNRLILAFGQVKAASFLRGTELRQFTEAGVPMLEELAKHFTELYGRVVSVDEAFEMISKRQVSFKDVEQVLKNMTSDGGVFYNMQEQMANTIRGRISNLKDEISLMFNEIGQESEGWIHGTIDILKTLIKNWRYVAAAIKTVLITYAAYQFNATMVALVTGKAAFAANALAAGEMAAFRSTNLLTRALARLKVAFTGMNVGGSFLTMIPTLVVSAVTAFAMFSDASEEASEAEKRRQEEMEQNIEQLRKKNEELISTVNKLKEAFAKAVDSKNITDQKIQLQKLIDIANEEYRMKIVVDVDGLTPDELADKIKEVGETLTEVSTTASYFTEEMEKALGGTIVDQAKSIDEARKKITTLDSNKLMGLFQYNFNMQKGESFEDYISRLETFVDSNVKQINVYIDEYEKLYKRQKRAERTPDKKVMKQYKDAAGMGYLAEDREFYAQYYRLKEFYELIQSILVFRNDIDGDYKNTFTNFLASLNTTNAKTMGILDESLDLAIRQYGEQKGVSDEYQNILIDWANSFFGFDSNNAIDDIQKKGLSDWQQRFNDYLATLRTESLKALEKEFGNDSRTWSKSSFNAYGALSTLPIFDEKNMDLTRKKRKEMIKGNMETAKEIIDAYEKGVGEIGAYTEKEYKIAKIEYEQYLKAYEFFGGDDKGAAKTAKQKLQEQIKLLEEMHKKYLELKKAYGDDKAQAEVRKAYEDTFTEVFKDTGITFDAYKTFGGFKDAASDAGAEAGTALTEGMQAKIDELTNKGIYIRDLDDTGKEAALEFIKGFEGSVNKAYKDIGSKKWAIGIGNNYDPETGEAITKDTVWTDEDIIRKNKVAMKSHMDALNDILDVHKDIIVTEEQYMALLDLTWQTGGAAALGYSKERDKFKSWLEDIDGMPIVRVLKDGTREKTGIFDIDVDKIMSDYDKAETAIEKVAIAMEYVGIRNSRDKDTTEFMINRGKERARLFKGDLDIAQQIEDALVTMDGLDFMTKEGMAKALSRLKELAKKAGPEVEKLLSKTISGYEAEIGLRIAEDADKELRKSVQDLFDRNSLTKELKKLQVPPDLAKALFGIDFLDNAGLKSEMITTYTKNLSEDAQKAVQDILAKGSSNITKEEWGIVAKYIGDDQITQAIQKDLEKVEDLEEKSLKERMKKYVEYSRKSLGKAGEIRLKQLLKMQDIEETFEWKEGDTEDIKLAKTEEGVRALDKAAQEANEAMAKLQWEEFRKSETFTSLMDDLGGASEDVLNKVIADLESFKEEWKDLPIDQMQEVVKLLNKAKRAKDSLDSPWAEARRLRGKIKNDGRTRAEAEADSYQAETENIALKKELQMIDLINQARRAGKNDEQIRLVLAEKYHYLLNQEVDLVQRRGDIEEKIGDNQTSIDNAQDRIDNEKELIRQYEEQQEVLSEVEKMAQDLYDSFKSLYEAIGGEGDDMVAVFADMGMNMMSTVLQTISLSIQLKSATQGAMAFGTALNTAMGVIGWIVMGVQLLTQAITAIAKVQDNILVDEIEKQAREIEGLQERYEDLEEAMDDAYSTEQVERLNARLRETTQALINAKKAAIAAQEARKGSDKIGSDNWNELQDMKKELKEMEDTLAESLEESFSKVTDGILDSVFDAAKEFTDAWLEAYKETGDGLKGLEENFEEMFMNLAKNQAAMQITGTFVDRWKRDLEDYINEDDTKLTKEEAKEWAEKVKATLPELSDALEGYLGAMSDMVGGTGLSELQKGVQGMSEQTAQVLESYLNSVRMYVATISADTTSQLNEVKAIHALLSSIVASNTNTGGARLKVYAQIVGGVK